MTTDEQSRVSSIDLKICQLRRQRRVITGEKVGDIDPQTAAEVLLALLPKDDGHPDGLHIQRGVLLELVQLLEDAVREGGRMPLIAQMRESRQARRDAACS